MLGDEPAVLIVDDDRGTLEALTAYLNDDGYAVLYAGDGAEGLRLALERRPALVLLDLNLPKLSGIEVFKRLRVESDVPVIMVTTRGEEIDRVVGIELGADDYIAKPFSPREVAARVKMVLRRAQAAPHAEKGGERDVLRFGELEIDHYGHEVRKRRRRLPLTPTEFRLLDVLSANAGRALTRSQLLDKVSGDGSDVFDRTLDRHVANLRQKIEDDPARPRYVLTVVGVGYKFASPRDF